MTRLSKRTVGSFAAALGALLVATEAAPVNAQCATCVTPTVAYSPVVVQPAPVVRTGWYPGYWIDRMRLRRWSAADATVAAPAYSVGYAPSYAAAYPPAYTSAYAPSYTAAYAPAATYTAGYTPYITAYAPMQQAVVQTSYSPVVAAAPCTGCAQSTTVSYAPSTVYRPVEVAPVVQTVIAAPACSMCSVEAPCGACSTCAPTASQASYVESTPSNCPTCAPATPAQPEYYGGATSTAEGGMSSTSPGLPQPRLTPEVAAPTGQEYGAQRPADASGTTSGTSPENSVVAPGPAAEEDATGPEAETGAETDSSTFYDFQAPPLLGPQNDRTANRPTVDVHNAVYSQPVRQARVSTTVAKVATQSSVAPGTDANGWYSVPDRN